MPTRDAPQTQPESPSSAAQNKGAHPNRHTSTHVAQPLTHVACQTAHALQMKNRLATDHHVCNMAPEPDWPY